MMRSTALHSPTTSLHTLLGNKMCYNGWPSITEPHFKPLQCPQPRRLRPTSSSPSQTRHSPPHRTGRSLADSPSNMSPSRSPRRRRRSATCCSCYVWATTRTACLASRRRSTPRAPSQPRCCPPVRGATSSTRRGMTPSSRSRCPRLPRPQRTSSSSTAYSQGTRRTSVGATLLPPRCYFLRLERRTTHNMPRRIFAVALSL